VTGPSETLPSATLTYTIAAGTVPANGKFTLSGAKLNLAAGAVAHKITVGTGPTGVIAVGNAAGVTVVASANETRKGGIDRYATAAQLFTTEFASSSVAVITSGVNFPDALSANVLASDQGTGILLTDPNTLPGATVQVLRGQSIDTVYIVGGPVAVSTKVENQIAAMHINNDPTQGLINVIRVQGADRYATNNAVNLTVGDNGPGGVAIIATGASFPDSLAVGPIVWAQGYPLVLVDPSGLGTSGTSTLVNLGITHAIIIGGTAAVPTSIETALKALNITVDARVSGADRTATAAQIAKWADAGVSGLAAIPAFTAAHATLNLARGDNFADALAAGPYAGQLHQLIGLTGNPSTLGTGLANYTAGKAGTITTINALGLAAAVTPAVVNAAVATLG